MGNPNTLYPKWPEKEEKKKTASKKRKAKKAKRTPKVGKKWQVWKGTRERTAGGLRKKDLRMRKGGISKWLAAVMKARKALKLKGFVACKKGTKYYITARKFYKK